MNKKQWKKAAKFWNKEYDVLSREHADLWTENLKLKKESHVTSDEREEEDSWERAYYALYGQFLTKNAEIRSRDDEIKSLKAQLEMLIQEKPSAEDYGYDSDDYLVNQYYKLLESYDKLKEEFDELEACVAERLVSEQSATADSGEVQSPVNELSTFNEFPYGGYEGDPDSNNFSNLPKSGGYWKQTDNQGIWCWVEDPIQLPTADELREKYECKTDAELPDAWVWVKDLKDEQNLNKDSSAS